jgi:hypothetical protein
MLLGVKVRGSAAAEIRLYQACARVRGGSRCSRMRSDPILLLR